HVVHRIRESGGERPDLAAGRVGTAILMTTATTCASFSVLLFTDHAGLESMALVMLVGLPLSLLASVTTLPALAAIWR
ncbi:MAG: MMPL family transporter, partial [Thermoanaerobaculia bacterium]|nr:MMPL family transporter [Thermoanaerobaculia bacterium]